MRTLRWVTAPRLFLALVSFWLALASGPGAAQTANVRFEDGGQLAVHRNQIEQLVAATFEVVSTQLSASDVRILVSADASRTIPNWGIGGYALGPNEVELVVAPNFPSLPSVLEERLPHILAHEFHHAVRWRSPGPYRTLLEALVSEGLADRFAVEALESDLPPWSMAFPDRDFKRYLDRARQSFDQTFDFNAWFFGIGSDLPQWTGYTLGYRMVVDYQALHPGETAADLVNAPADAFRSLTPVVQPPTCPFLITKVGGPTSMRCFRASIRLESDH